jgi:glutathionyl-hydroquinone reductase
LNAGVYKAGFADSQETYDKNVVPVFGALNKIEKIIAENGGPFVLGREMTELDVRLYVTAIRFDVAYVQHFKCNLGMIRQVESRGYMEATDFCRNDYPVVHNWLKNLYWNHDDYRNTTNFKHIKEGVSSTYPNALGVGPSTYSTCPRSIQNTIKI